MKKTNEGQKMMRQMHQERDRQDRAAAKRKKALRRGGPLFNVPDKSGGSSY